MSQSERYAMSRESEITVAQMAAFFLYQNAKKMSHLKLIKLLYLADREMIKQYGTPISFDYPVSMPYGPALSKTLNLIDGTVPSHQGGWDTWISAKANHQVSLKQHAKDSKTEFEAKLDRIDKVALEVLRQIWEAYKNFDQWQISDWTHQYCKEWENPQNSSKPIRFADIATAVEIESNAAENLGKEIEYMQSIRNFCAT